MKEPGELYFLVLKAEKNLADLGPSHSPEAASMLGATREATMPRTLGEEEP